MGTSDSFITDNGTLPLKYLFIGLIFDAFITIILFLSALTEKDKSVSTE